MMDNWSDDDIKNGFEFLDSMEEISTTVKEIKVLNEAVRWQKRATRM